MRRIIAILMVLCMIFGLSSIGVCAAVLEQGTELASPEEGWQRIGCENTNWTWGGDWTKKGIGATYSTTAYQKINFTGDRIRLIDHSTSACALHHYFYVDGVKYEAIQPKITLVLNVVYDLQGLEDKEHSLVITTELGDSSHHSGIAYIDIADTATVKPYNSQVFNLEISSVGNKSVGLSWDAIDDATSYNVKRSTTSGGVYTTIATTSAITYTDTDVTNGTTYYYVVSAVVDSAESDNSDEVSATPMGEYAPAVLINVGETQQLSVTDYLADNSKLNWSSTDESVATVDSKGRVTGVAEGTASIYAISDDTTFSEFIPVKVVYSSVDDMTLSLYLNVGDQSKLYITDDIDSVTWSSLDESIATVSSTGKVTAVSGGLVIIQGVIDGNTYQFYVRVDD